MSFTVIITEGIKTAYTQRVKRMEGESRGLLTIVAQANTMRIDFLRPQIAHVLKANITGLDYVSAGRLRRNVAYLRSHERTARIRRPSPCGQGDATLRARFELTALHISHYYSGLGLLKMMRLANRVERLRGKRTGNKTSIAVRKAG